jgi:hypothetical protein
MRYWNFDSSNAMTQFGEATACYHKALDQDRERNLAWVRQFREEMAARHLVVNGRAVSPVLRPHFLSRRQYSSLVSASEALGSAIERLRAILLEDQRMLARLSLLPAERMLATVDPGYASPTVAGLMETQVNNGTLRITAPQADLPYGVIYGEVLGEMFQDAPPLKELRKSFKLTRPLGAKPLVASLQKAWKQFGGTSVPRVAVIEFKQVYSTFESAEYALLVERLRAEGLRAEVVSPEQLEYRNGVLRKGDFTIDVVYRGVRAQEFLLRYDLTHPLVRAYRDGKVCVVNNFRTELTRKRALLALLSDETVSGSFPAVERQAIESSIPWTRIVEQGKTTFEGQPVDLVDFILKNRERLVLKPNVDGGELHSTEGHMVDDTAWERALRVALHHPYVVEQCEETHDVTFPVEENGRIVYRDLRVEVAPHAYLGKVQGCSTRVSTRQGGYTAHAGLAPTLILDPR